MKRGTNQTIDRVIIRNRTALPIEQALRKIMAVMEMGRISAGRNGPQHCYVTTFADNTVVLCKRRASQETFTVLYDHRASDDSSSSH